MKPLHRVWRCPAGDAGMEWKHREGVQTAHAVSNWRLSDWFLTCATCFFFVWSHSLTLCSNVWKAHIPQMYQSFFFFKPITSVKKNKKKKILKRRYNRSGNELYSWCWKGKYIAADIWSDASFLLWSPYLVTLVLSLLHCLWKSKSVAKMWLKPLQTSI